MAHWPKTLRGNVLTVLLIVVGMPLVLVVAIGLSGPLVWVWAGSVLVAVTSVALYIWRRRIDDERQRAWIGAFSFADVRARMDAKDALERSGWGTRHGRPVDRTSQTPSIR